MARLEKLELRKMNHLTPFNVVSLRRCRRCVLCLDSNPGGGNVFVLIYPVINMLCLDSNPGGGNVRSAKR